MKLYGIKHKAMHLIINGEKVILPVIYHSYLYSLWVLSHKYDNIKLLDITSSTEFPTKFTASSYTFNYTLPNLTPKNLLNINVPTEVINYLGVEEYMLLTNFEKFDEVIDLMVKGKVANERNKLFTQYTTYFDMYLVHLSLKIKKITGKAVMYKGTNIYKLSGISRKGFNKLVDRTRDILNIPSNRVTLWRQKKKEVYKELTVIEREYMESQLQEFFNLLHERINIE